MAIIENIRLLKNAAVLAERKANTPSLALKQSNLVYGFNGSGKSTLSRIFAGLQRGTSHSKLPAGCTFEIEMSDGAKFAYPKSLVGLEKRVCVFNNDFIDENLRWESGVASPIFYIGADQAEAAAQLKALEAKLPAAKTKLEAEASILAEREKAFSDYKKLIAGTISRNLRQAARYEAPQFVADINKLSATAVKLLDPELDAAIATCARSEPPAKVRPIEVPISTLIETIAAAGELAPKSIGSIVIQGLDEHPEMVPWVREGHRYHVDHSLTTCLYCAAPLQDFRKELLTASFDQTLTDYTSKLDASAHNAGDCMNALAAAETAIPAAAQLSAEFQPAFETAASEFSTAIKNVIPLLSISLDALQERQRTPTSPVAITLPSADDIKVRLMHLEECCKAVNAVCSQHADMVDDFVEHQKKARDAIRRHFLYISASDYGNHVAGIDAAQSQEANEKAILDKLEQDIEQLRAKIQQHGPAADKINALIKSYLGHNELTIVPITEGYELHRHGMLVTGAPSEGEKTAIALCYFLSTLEAEERKIKDLIIVIDDPISSLDTKAMNYACGLIRNRLHDASQLIILTHNQQCMNEFKKHWKNWARATPAKASLKFIDVSIPASTMSRTANIVDLPRHLRDYESEYHYLFEKVIAFSKVGAGHFDYAFMMPNVLRRVLEVFMAFKVPRDGNLSDKLKTLYERHKDLDRDRLNALERLCQIESHSDSLEDLIGLSSLTIEESREANEALLHLMETVDLAHVDDLKKYCKA